MDCSLFVLERACHFKHSVELVDREGNIVDVLAAGEDFLLAQARTSRETAMAKGAHSAEPADEDRGGQQWPALNSGASVAFTGAGIAAVVILLITLWGHLF